MVVAPQNGPVFPVIVVGPATAPEQQEEPVIFPIVINCLPGFVQAPSVAHGGVTAAPQGVNAVQRVTLNPLLYFIVICVTGPVKLIVTLPWEV